MKNLTQGKPLPVILRFALPLLIGQLFQLCYSLVDTRIVGSTLGEVSLAAVGATTTLSDLLIGLMNGITNGFAILIATYFGAGDERGMRRAIGAAVTMGVGFALLVSGGCLVGLGPILRFLHVEGEILVPARQYIRIILAGLIAATCYNICASILRAIGDSFTPLLFLVIAAVLNVALDYCFILWLGLGVGGASLATVAAQSVSAVLCFFYMRRRYPKLRLSREDFRLDRAVCGKLLKAGISMGFMVSFVSMGTLALQTAINTFGTNIIVAHTAARKASSMFMLPWSVLGTTLATYCGQNLGAGRYERMKTGIRQTLFVVWGWVLFVILIANLFGRQIAYLITSSREPEILDTAALYLRVNTAFYFVPAVISLFRNAMQGFGDTKTPLFSSSLELAGKVLIAFLLVPALGYWGIIISEPIVWFVMVIPLIVNMLRSPAFRAGRQSG